MHGLRITSLEHTDVFFGQIIRLVEQTLRIRPLSLVIFTTLAVFARLFRLVKWTTGVWLTVSYWVSNVGNVISK